LPEQTNNSFHELVNLNSPPSSPGFPAPVSDLLALDEGVGNVAEPTSTFTSSVSSTFRSYAVPESEIDLSDTSNIHIPELLKTAQFISGLKHATIEFSGMSLEDITQLRSPRQDINSELSDPQFILALESFLGCVNASEETYGTFRRAYLRRHPDQTFLSYDQMKQRLGSFSGVSAIYQDMCSKSCIGFTGPYSTLDECPKCASPRFYPGTRRPQKQFMTIPIGPIIQAFYSSPSVSQEMHYLEKRLAKNLEHGHANNGKIKLYDDTACGSDLLVAHASGNFYAMMLHFKSLLMVPSFLNTRTLTAGCGSG
jgi:hypothetical protein